MTSFQSLRLTDQSVVIKTGFDVFRGFSIMAGYPRFIELYTWLSLTIAKLRFVFVTDPSATTRARLSRMLTWSPMNACLVWMTHLGFFSKQSRTCEANDICDVRLKTMEITLNNFETPFANPLNKRYRRAELQLSFL